MYFLNLGVEGLNGSGDALDILRVACFCESWMGYVRKGPLRNKRGPCQGIV